MACVTLPDLFPWRTAVAARLPRLYYPLSRMPCLLCVILDRIKCRSSCSKPARGINSTGGFLEVPFIHSLSDILRFHCKLMLMDKRRKG